MGIYLYGQPSNLDCMGKVSWSQEVCDIIDKYSDFTTGNMFEISLEDLNKMIDELKQIPETGSLTKSLENMIAESVNADYFILACF